MLALVSPLALAPAPVAVSLEDVPGGNFTPDELERLADVILKALQGGDT
jgi:hypothetical protein